MVSGLLELLRSFLRARLSTAAVNGFSSPVLRCWFRVPHCVPKAQLGHNVVVDTLDVSHADIFKSQTRAAGGSPTQWQINWEYYVFYKYGGHDPTIAGYAI